MAPLLSLCSMVAVLACTPCALASTDTEPLSPPGDDSAVLDLPDRPASAPEPADPAAAGSASLGGAVFSPFAIGTVGASLPGPATARATASDEGDLTWAISSCVAGLLAFACLLRRVWNG